MADAAARSPATSPPGAVAGGNLYVIAAPSGGGKTSLVRALLEREADIRLSVSYTTRAPRPGEVDGVHYRFVDEPGFLARKDAGEFLEHAHVHGNWYATSATWLQKQVAAGHDVLLEIDWQGARQVRKLIGAAVTIFILPPSLASLKERLEKRGQDSPAVIARRLEAAREEMRHCSEFDYVIINQEFATAVDDLAAIVRASRLRGTPQLTRHAALLDALLAS
jgi:guanylate kinase